MTGKVFKFEFLNEIRKKSFLITMSIMVVLLILVGFIPKLISMFSNDDEMKYGLVSDLSYISEEEAKFATDSDVIVYSTEEDLKNAIENKEVDRGIVFKDGKRKAYLKSSSLSAAGEIEGVMKKFAFFDSRNDLINYGLNESEVDKFLNVNRDYDIVALKQDGAKNFWMVYITIFILYFLLMSYGNIVAMSVAREKSDRTMELLITSVKPKYLIRGKVYAYGLLGVLVLIVLYGASLIGTRFGMQQEIGAEFFSKIDLNVSIDQLIVNLTYFVVGYIMYLYLFASAASLVSRLEDVSIAIQPVILVYVAGFIITMISLGNPGIVLKIASYVPFTSPLAMIARYGLSYVSPVEVGISILILVVTTLVVRVFAVKMYRMGSLNYGNKVKFFKSVFKSIKEN